MPFTPARLVAVGLCAATCLVVVRVVDRAISPRARVPFRYLVTGAAIAGWFGFLGTGAFDRARAVDLTKALIAIGAAAAVFYERHRAGERRPIAERWKRFVGITLGVAAIVAYFDGLKPGYPRFTHRHDQYHYYLGAKYFRELGYDRLYRCTAIAEDEIGVVSFQDEDHIGAGRFRLDLTKEVRHPDRKIRDVGGDNLLEPVAEVLEHPELCKRHFAPARWEAFKRDVLYFRLGADKKYWEGFQLDHGYNPPPVWTMCGWVFASMFPAGERFDLPVVGQVVWLQVLASLDIAYMVAMFTALSWAFGWRVFAVGAIFWGCQASAPALWTYGAFLRQDWLFWLVFSACLARKRWYAASGASLVFAALLRVFPGLVAIGWLVVAGHQLARQRSLTRPQWRVLAGGTLAAALLIPASTLVAGAEAYPAFYRHTLEAHDATPLTNHMGLRVLVSQKLPFEIKPLGIGVGVQSGRAKYTMDNRLTDPFDLWMRMRSERYDRLRPVAYLTTLLSLAGFIVAVRRLRSLWIAQCLALVFVILMSQLTSYYYVFMILLAPLTKASRRLEVPLFGFAAVTQFAFMAFPWNDDKYWVLTLVSLVFCYGVLCAFGRGALARKKARCARCGRCLDLPPP